MSTSDKKVRKINENDRRVKRTKRVLREALFSLLEEKSANQISVTELTERADVNRATFYFYYNDIFDMLDRIQDEAFTLFSEIIHKDEGLEVANYDNLVQFIGRFLAFCRDNSDLCRFAINHDTNNKIFARIEEVIVQLVPDTTKFFGENDPRRYITKFALSGLVGVIIDWLEDGMKASPEDLADVMVKLYLNGAISSKRIK